MATEQRTPESEPDENSRVAHDGSDGDADSLVELARLGAQDSRLRRELYASEAKRNRSVLKQLGRSSDSILDELSRVRLEGHAHPGHLLTPRTESGTPVRDQALTSLGLDVRGTPFDFEWHLIQDWGTPSADRFTGAMRLQVDSRRDTPGDTSHTWNGAGVGIRVRTQSSVTLMRVSGFMPYDFRWHDDSNLEVAHNRGELRVLVREIGGVTRLDHRQSLWNDGTSWYEEHGDESSGVFNDSLYVFVEPNRDHEIWVWFNSSIDYTHEGGSIPPVSSSASNDLNARLAFLVTEQYGA
ncbi:MAG: hypothetical protein ABI137_12280 [Antricoccus sp.]